MGKYSLQENNLHVNIDLLQNIGLNAVN